MTKTHALTAGAMNKPASIFVPIPDLLNLVKTNLHGDAGTSAMFSIVGGLAFRCASLAGMIANALAKDAREASSGIDSFNDCMSRFDEMEHAQWAFDYAGVERQDMCKNLTEMLGFKLSCDDYLMQLVGDRYKPTNWLETFTMVAQPRAVDQWSIDDEWNTYIEQLNGAEPEMEKAEFDKLSLAALQGPRAAWAAHLGAVFNILEAADKGQALDFYSLDRRTQFSLLTKYGSPEQFQKFRLNVKRSMMGRAPMEILGRISLYKAFVAGCQLATTHHRYNGLNGSQQEPAKPEPKAVIPDKGTHAEYIAEAVSAEKRAHAQAVIDNKIRKPKEVSDQVKAKAMFAIPKAEPKLKANRNAKPKSVKSMQAISTLEPITTPAPATTAAATTSLADMPNDIS